MGFKSITKKCDSCGRNHEVGAADPAIIRSDGWVLTMEKYICPVCVKTSDREKKIRGLCHEIKDVEDSIIAEGGR